MPADCCYLSSSLFPIASLMVNHLSSAGLEEKICQHNCRYIWQWATDSSFLSRESLQMACVLDGSLHHTEKLSCSAHWERCRSPTVSCQDMRGGGRSCFVLDDFLDTVIRSRDNIRCGRIRAVISFSPCVHRRSPSECERGGRLRGRRQLFCSICAARRWRVAA